jgi:hypothetical protein
MEHKILFDYMDTYSDLEQEIIKTQIAEIEEIEKRLDKGQDLTPYQFNLVSEILGNHKRRVENGGIEFLDSEVMENFFIDIDNGLFPDTWLNKPIKVSGTLGFWNGRKEIEPKYYTNLEEAFNKLLSGYDNFRLSEKNGKYTLSLIHHDSTHELELEAVDTIPEEVE